MCRKDEAAPHILKSMQMPGDVALLSYDNSNLSPGTGMSRAGLPAARIETTIATPRANSDRNAKSIHGT